MKMIMEINKEAHFSRRQSFGLDSNLDSGIFARRKAINIKFAFLANWFVFPNKVTKKSCVTMYGCYGIFFLLSILYKFINAEDSEIVN